MKWIALNYLMNFLKWNELPNNLKWIEFIVCIKGEEVKPGIKCVRMRGKMLG